MPELEVALQFLRDMHRKSLKAWADLENTERLLEEAVIRAKQLGANPDQLKKAARDG